MTDVQHFLKVDTEEVEQDGPEPPITNEETKQESTQPVEQAVEEVAEAEAPQGNH